MRDHPGPAAGKAAVGSSHEQPLPIRWYSEQSLLLLLANAGDGNLASARRRSCPCARRGRLNFAWPSGKSARGMTTSPRIDLDRLLGRFERFNRIGALPGGGVCRLALSNEDRAGRDLLVQWMREVGLTVTIDAIGNIIGVRGGRKASGHEDLAPVMFGSHIDTVGTGGCYDGLYGVLAGLEACEASTTPAPSHAVRWRWSPSPTRKGRALRPTRWGVCSCRWPLAR